MGESNLDHEKIIKGIYRDCFNIQEKYMAFPVLTDDDWEDFISEQEEIEKKYKDCKTTHKFCAKMLLSVTTYFEERQKEIKNDG